MTGPCLRVICSKPEPSPTPCQLCYTFHTSWTSWPYAFARRGAMSSLASVVAGHTRFRNMIHRPLPARRQCRGQHPAQQAGCNVSPKFCEPHSHRKGCYLTKKSVLSPNLCRAAVQLWARSSIFSVNPPRCGRLQRPPNRGTLKLKTNLPSQTGKPLYAAPRGTAVTPSPSPCQQTARR